MSASIENVFKRFVPLNPARNACVKCKLVLEALGVDKKFNRILQTLMKECFKRFVRAKKKMGRDKCQFSSRSNRETMTPSRLTVVREWFADVLPARVEQSRLRIRFSWSSFPGKSNDSAKVRFIWNSKGNSSRDIEMDSPYAICLTSKSFTRLPCDYNTYFVLSEETFIRNG